jgi:hypothetical protein
VLVINLEQVENSTFKQCKETLMINTLGAAFFIWINATIGAICIVTYQRDLK